MLFIFVHVLAEIFIASTNSNHNLASSEFTKALVDSHHVAAVAHVHNGDLDLVEINAISQGLLQLVLGPLDEGDWSLAEQVGATLVKLRL